MRGPGRTFADELREWARADPRVRDLVATLPPLVSSPPPGLFADASGAPWSSVDGEMRVSVLRIVSVPETGATPVLVAQVHATETTHPTLRFRRIRHVVHAPAAAPREVACRDAWWLAVLDRHYALGGHAVPGTHAVVRA